jgi:cyclin B
LNKKNKATLEDQPKKELQKVKNLVLPIKQALLRNKTLIKKIPSSYNSTSSLNNNNSNNSKNVPKNLKKIKNNRKNNIQFIKKRFLDEKDKKNKNNCSEIQSSYNNNSTNHNTTSNTRHNSNQKSKSFHKNSDVYRINLKTMSKKKSNKDDKIENKISENVKKINSADDLEQKDDDRNKNVQRFNNIKFAEEYINDIYQNLLQEERELKLKIDSNYFSFQTEINDKMRAILIDWIIDVHMKFGFKEETLYNTIYIIDSYLTLKKIERKNLQLLGVTSLFIACKQNEVTFRRLNEYAYITDNAYKVSDIIDMENEVLKTLNFNILYPSSLSFYEILSKKMNIINDTEQFALGEFLMQSFYMNSNSLNYSFSIIACSVSYIVMKFFKIQNYKFCYDKSNFNDLINKNNSKEINIIKECAKDICSFINEMPKYNLESTIRKFSNKKYGNVSRLIFGALVHNN